MNRSEILVIGTNESVLQNAIQQINTNNKWNAVAAFSAEDAIEKVHQQDFDLVAFTSDVTAEEKKLRRILAFQQPDTIIIQNNMDDNLIDAIKTTLEQQRKNNQASFSFVDDALKNAMLPITIQ